MPKKPELRELNDFGGFEPKPGETTWRFRRKGIQPVDPTAQLLVDRSARCYIDARELAARELGRVLGADVAPQDVVGLPVNDKPEQGASDAEQKHQKPDGAASPVNGAA